MILRTLCLITTICAFFTNINAQFVWSNPQPSGWGNTKIAFTGAAIGYVMNANGDLIKTTDGGGNWKIITNLPRCLRMDVKDSIVMAGGADTTIYTSSDSGKTWQKGVIRHTEILSKIQIVSKDTAFAVSKSPNTGTTELFRSVDRGHSWQLINGTLIIKDVDFINSKLGYATSFGGIYKTLDGGATWQQVYTQTGGYSFVTIEFLNEQIGYAAQDLGVVIKTTDGGNTWTTCLNSTYGRIYTISFANASTIFLGGEDGSLYRSTDAGVSWQLKPNHLGDRYGIYSIHCINTNTAFFVGLRGQIFKTTNGGDSYTDYSPTYLDVKPIAFPTPEVGYAGMWADLFKTTNGGQSWTKLAFTAGNSLYQRFQQLHFFSKDTGLALSESPVQIFKTYNGGQTWTAIAVTPLTPDLIKGFFVLGNTVYLNLKTPVGTHMLRSADRGETWRTQAINYSNNHDFRNFFFTDEKTGFAVIGPFLYKTSDSAKTWSQVVLPNNYSFAMNSIWFTSAATGYIAGDQGFNHTTVDSGKTWQQFAITPGNFNFQNVYAIRFFNAQVGYLVSGLGGIYRTANAGKDWAFQMTAPWDCRTIEMTKDSQVVIGGEHGIILKKDMREYAIDSFSFSQGASCGAKLSAKITAVLSKVDSITVEYGATGFTRMMSASPFSVSDSSVRVEGILNGLSADTLYMARFRVRYRTGYQYSSTINFRPVGTPSKPTISVNGNVLLSSATTGNQWFLNGTSITGATQPTYTLTGPGVYTVQQTLNGCASVLSDPYNYTVTSITDPLLAEAVQLFPNPATDYLWIKNDQLKRLRLTLLDRNGHVVLRWETTKSLERISLQSLASGVYLLMIEDKATQRKSVAKLVKI